MPGIVFTPLPLAELQQAAQACDDLASQLQGQLSNISGLRGQVNSAWQGDGGTSLNQAISDRARLVSTAISDLQSAASALRAAFKQRDPRARG